MASTRGKPWLNDEGNIFEFTGQAAAPSKDFCQILVRPNQLIYRWWKISPRSSEQRMNPGEVKESHDDFVHDDRTQGMIQCAFGANMATYVKNLCLGQIDYIARLPDNVVINILVNCDLEDIAAFSQTCKRFYQLCNSDDLWEKVYLLAGSATDSIRALAAESGWKKVFFTNKLQLQLQLRRKRKAGTAASAQESGGRQRKVTAQGDGRGSAFVTQSTAIETRARRSLKK